MHSVGAFQVEIHSVGVFQVVMHSVDAFYEILFKYSRQRYKLHPINLHQSLQIQRPASKRSWLPSLHTIALKALPVSRLSSCVDRVPSPPQTPPLERLSHLSKGPPLGSASHHPADLARSQAPQAAVPLCPFTQRAQTTFPELPARVRLRRSRQAV